MGDTIRSALRDYQASPRSSRITADLLQASRLTGPANRAALSSLETAHLNKT